MHKGLDRIGLGQVGWKILVKWFNSWAMPLATVLVVLIAIKSLPMDTLYIALCFFGVINLIQAGLALSDPWFNKPKDLTLAEAEHLLGVDMPQDEEPSF